MALKPMTVARLKVVRTTEFGAFLDAGTDLTSDDILLHKHQQTRPVSAGEFINVFLYLDPKKQLAASMRVPKLAIDEVAQVKVINASKDGLFVDVGAERGIFMPFAEMIGRPKVGDRVRVKLYVDKSGRLAVSMKGALAPRSDEQKARTLERDAERILKFMRQTDGFIDEQSSPAFIQTKFNISKSAFKRAIGHLFRQHRIERLGPGFKLASDEAGDYVARR